MRLLLVLFPYFARISLDFLSEKKRKMNHISEIELLADATVYHNAIVLNLKKPVKQIVEKFQYY